MAKALIRLIKTLAVALVALPSPAEAGNVDVACSIAKPGLFYEVTLTNKNANSIPEGQPLIFRLAPAGKSYDFPQPEKAVAQNGSLKFIYTGSDKLTPGACTAFYNDDVKPIRIDGLGCRVAPAGEINVKVYITNTTPVTIPSGNVLFYTPQAVMMSCVRKRLART